MVVKPLKRAGDRFVPSGAASGTRCVVTTYVAFRTTTKLDPGLPLHPRRNGSNATIGIQFFDNAGHVLDALYNKPSTEKNCNVFTQVSERA